MNFETLEILTSNCEISQLSRDLIDIAKSINNFLIVRELFCFDKLDIIEL